MYLPTDIILLPVARIACGEQQATRVLMELSQRKVRNNVAPSYDVCRIKESESIRIIQSHEPHTI